MRWTAVLAGITLSSVALLIVYGVAIVDRSMGGGLAASPRVLSAPLVIHAGEPWTLDALRAAVARRGIPESSGASARQGEFAVAGGALVLGGGVTVGAGEIAVVPGPAGVSIADAARRRLGTVTVRPTILGAPPQGDVVRWPVPLAEVSPLLATAVVDVEDRTFLSHAGLSMRGLARAALRDLLAGGVSQGGSTITQQLAKNIMLRPARTVARKIMEAWLASLLEYRFNKREILQAYLNRIYLGQDGGIQVQGVEAAAQLYFGKRAADLEIEEAALLAGMIAAPNRFDPFSHPEAARARREAVLAAMAREGHITADRLASATAAPLPAPGRRLRWAPAAQYVERAVQEQDAPGALATALDVDLQDAVSAGCAAGLQALEVRHAKLRALKAWGDPLQVAVVAVAPDGRVLALLGSRDGAAGQFDRATSARRQVGSLVKPFVAALALESGWHVDDALADEPLTVTFGTQTWSPQDSDGRYRGQVTLREALIHSLNVPMVRLGLAVSLPRVLDRLRRIGFAPPAGSPAVLLGAFEATPMEVARAYASLLGLGTLPRLTYASAPVGAGERVAEGGACAEIVRVLTEVPVRGTAASLAGTVRGALAAKTGTTDERRDSWFVALRPRFVMVTWVGTDANRETGLLGATGALEVWREIDRRIPGALIAAAPVPYS